MFKRGKIEIAGSFALNIFQRIHADVLKYTLPSWKYNDIDIFVTGGEIEFHDVIADFEEKLSVNDYIITKRTIKRFTEMIGEKSVDQVLSHGVVGDIRLIDYSIEDIPYEISIINTTSFDEINQVTSSFDISACAISCVMTRGTGEFLFGFNWGTNNGFTPQSDIISGIGHILYTTTNTKRIDKYKERGFSSMKLMDEDEYDRMREKFVTVYTQRDIFPEVEYSSLPPSIYSTTAGDVPIFFSQEEEIKIMTFNCDYKLGGTNGIELVNFIIDHEITHACLQEVTISLVETIKSELIARSSTYAIYTVVDNDEAPGDFYGLCLLTKQNVNRLWSLPISTEQNRRVDIVFTDQLIIANIHAESLAQCDARREEQITEIVKYLDEGMKTCSYKGVFVVGDFNIRTSSSAEKLIDILFTDTNSSGPQNTMRDLHTHIRYYDRVLIYKCEENVNVMDWSIHETVPSDHNILMVTISLAEKKADEEPVVPKEANNTETSTNENVMVISKKQGRVCSVCGTPGHNKRTCPKKK